MEIAERLERYRYDPERGRLRQRAPGGAYEYDAGGRTTEDGRWRYRYGAQGRLAEITRATTGQRRAAYCYNALSERVRKLGTSVTYYHYDLEGRLLAETDAGGQTRAEYLYLGNEPLALSRSGQLYYYHNDHLGTPQKLTNGAGQVVWSARYRPFGEASIGVGYVTQNLRFPRQYYDEESGLHYNYHRYYDPDIGRYLTSDPIGLAGGMNTYTYVENNPINFIDRFGLCTDYWNRYMDHLNEYLINVGPYASALAGGLWPKLLAPATGGRPPLLGSSNPLTSVPRAVGIPGAGSAVVRTGAAGIGVAIVGIGFYNIGVFASGLGYAAFPSSNGLPADDDFSCEGQ